MWPFRRRTHDIAKTLEAFLEQNLDVAERGSRTMLERGENPFVLVRLRDDSTEHLVVLIGKLMEIALEHSALVDSVMSSHVVLTAMIGPGRHFPGSQLATKLNQALGSDAKILHGTRMSTRGLVAGGSLTRFVTIFESFSECVSAVERLAFGEVHGAP
jgi:hypothetical protein